MNLKALMDEVVVVLEQIDGVQRAYGWPPETVSPPAGYVSYPESIDFDQTYRRGLDKVVGLPIVLVSYEVTSRRARDRVADWSAGAGPTSVKAILEAHRWQSCDDLTVTACRFDVETIADIPYLVAVFTADATGPGGV